MWHSPGDVLQFDERERERASIRQRRVWSWSSDIYKGAGRCGNSSIIFLVYSRFMSNHNRTGSPRERKSIGQRVTRSPRLGPWDIFKRARLVLLAHHAEPRIGIRVRASVSASFRDSLSLSLSPRRDAIRVHWKELAIPFSESAKSTSPIPRNFSSPRYDGAWRSMAKSFFIRLKTGTV